MRDFGLFIVLMVCGFVGMYEFGVWHERRAYTSVFVKQIEAAYFEGYNDCLMGLRKPQ